jgi:iron complex transport system substrate-binding protein
VKLFRTVPAALIGAAVLATGLVACSDNSPEPTDPTGGTTSTTQQSTQQTTSAAQSQQTASWPVTVDHVRGSSTVPAKPERIVVMHEAAVDPVLSLGLEPVAMFEIQGGDANMPWLQGKIDWPEDAALTADRTADPEAVAKYDPDLIVVGDVYADDSTWKALEDVAPTLVYDWPADGPAWQPILEGIAQATGLEDRAEEVRDSYAGRIAEIQAQFPGVGDLTYNSAMLNQGQLVYSTNSLLEDLGLEQADRQKAAGARGTVSLERLDELDADVLVIYDPAGERKKLEDSDQFRGLASVRDGALIWQDTALGYAVTTASGPMSLDWAVDRIAPQLTAAL